MWIEELEIEGEQLLLPHLGLDALHYHHKISCSTKFHACRKMFSKVIKHRAIVGHSLKFLSFRNQLNGADSLRF
jgi:hypothetical protein